MKLKVFHATDGDCLLLTSSDNHHALIDGGRTGSFRDHTQDTLQELAAANEALDLVVVSHIDADHISGILWLLRGVADWTRFDFQTNEGGNPGFARPDVPRPPVIKKIWHNSWLAQVGDLAGPIEALASAVSAARFAVGPDPTTSAAGTDLMDALDGLAESIPEGVELRRIIDDDTPIPKNKPFTGMVLLRDPPHVERLGKTKLTVIGPATKHLERLREDWKEWLADKPAGGGGVDEGAPVHGGVGAPRLGLGATELTRALASERAQGEQLLNSLTAAAEIIAKTNPSRVTPPNRASIILLAEERRRRCLLTGDAAEEEILEGLAAAGKIVNGQFRCNVLKVQHHGSEHNLSVTFAQTVLADNYVFCGDGAHGNPDPSVVKTIAETRLAADPSPFTMWFTCSPERTLSTRRSALRAAIDEAQAAAAPNPAVTVNVLDDARPFFELPV